MTGRRDGDGGARVLAGRNLWREYATMNQLKLGIPKGSLQDATIELFARAGLENHAERAKLRAFHRR